MSVEYIVVQAGGKGTRLGYLTKNKPKCLVPVGNLPMIFHLFKKFPDKKFIVIGDYKYDVLEKYLEAFANVDYKIVNASGNTGTCSGLNKAIELIPDKSSFALIWSDLILADDFELPEKTDNAIFLSGDFPCRWKYENNIFSEEASVEFGVAGFFSFENKNIIADVPESGEFVRWLSEKNIVFEVYTLKNTKEYGLLEEYNKKQVRKWRPFNDIKVENGKVYKSGVDEQGKALAVRERGWYKTINDYNYSAIPEIYSYEPLVMEYVKGKNLYELEDLSFEEKKNVLFKLFSRLTELHELDKCSADRASVDNAYISKTIGRLEKVKNLIPFSDDDYIEVNGKKCKNILKNIDELYDYLDLLIPDDFKLIHGDCTFSNTMLSDEGEIVFIDPRGYFGETEMFGDEAYDWAKVYYSLVGNYDKFNLKKFLLEISEDKVTLKINSNGWEDLEEEFFNLLGKRCDKIKIKLIHAIIWLSLTTYAWDDYDSVCGAFYNGLWYLQEVTELLENNYE